MRRKTVIRVLTYDGPENWVNECLARRGIHGVQDFTPRKRISETIVSENVYEAKDDFLGLTQAAQMLSEASTLDDLKLIEDRVNNVHRYLLAQIDRKTMEETTGEL